MFAEVRQSLLVDVVVSPDSFVPITAELSYSPGDPFAVSMRFPRGSTRSGEPVEWTFARDLLGTGTGTPSGLGDVRIWPLGASRTAVALVAPDGRALLEVATADLLRFLDRTYERTISPKPPSRYITVGWVVVPVRAAPTRADPASRRGGAAVPASAHISWNPQRMRLIDHSRKAPVRAS